MFKKITRFLSVVFSLLFILLIAPFFFKDTIKEKTLEWVNSHVSAEVAFDNIQLSFLSNFPKVQITLNELQIINKAPFKGDTLFVSEKIDLSVSAMQLISSNDQPLAVETITLTNAIANLKVASDGSVNYDIVKKSKEVESSQEKEGNTAGFSLKLQKYTIDNLTVRYQNLIDNSHIHVDRIFHQGSGNFQNSVVALDTHTQLGLGFTSENIRLEEAITVTLDAILSNYESKYQKQVPRQILEIGRQIITHFQLYFIQKIEPEIILMNQDDVELNLTSLFNREFQKEILEKPFEISNQKFQIFISKSFKAKSHKIHYCAHERNVKDEGLSKYLEDLKFKIVSESEEGFYFQVFVIGNYLNENVNEGRTGFNFSLEEDNEEIDFEEITLSKIRKGAIICVEELLSDFLEKVRKEKLDKYFPIIEEEFPNYSSVINYNMDKVKMLPVGLSKHELDLKLYEIESEWRIKVKTEGIDLIDKKKDVTELEDYKELYSKFLTEFNEVGQSDLARYIVHRRAVIDLLDKLIELNEDDKFENEDIIHSLFFPIKETGDSVLTEKQNLWLLDERLTYNSLLASDKLFKQIDQLNSDSTKRMDLVVKKEEIFQNATLYSEDKYPFESFTIVEFKKPERDNYVHGIYKDDPIKQVRTYIEEIVDGKQKIRGKRIEADMRTPFYCYIVADITPSLQKIVDFESFNPTPDGLGYFRFYETITSRAYIEVLPFKKIIKDAKQRNKILFDKLKLS